MHNSLRCLGLQPEYGIDQGLPVVHLGMLLSIMMPTEVVPLATDIVGRMRKLSLLENLRD